MSDKHDSKPAKRIRRHRYVIDFRQQARLTLPFFAAAISLGILNALAHMVAVGYGDIWTLEPAEATDVLLLINLIFVLLSAGVMAVTGLAVSNRVFGPTMVMKRALKTMKQGDDGREVRVRKDDFLQPLVGDLEDLRQEMNRRRDLVQDANACIAEGDLDAAREILQQLGAEENAVEPAEAVSKA